MYQITVHKINREKLWNNCYVLPHSHEFYHMFYIQDGEGEVEINGKWVPALPGNFFIIPPHTPHSIAKIKDYSALTVKLSADEALSKRLNSLGTCIPHLSIQEYGILSSVLDEAVTRPPYYDEFILLKLNELFLLLDRRKSSGHLPARDRSEITRSDRKLSSAIADVITYIEANPKKNFTMRELASRSGYSENYFHIIFKNEIGMSPIKYINLYKMNLAKQYLRSTQMSITQISDALGFDNIHYFSRLFKKTTGMPPSEYASLVSDNFLLDFSDGDVSPFRNIDAGMTAFDGMQWRDPMTKEPVPIPEHVAAKFASNQAAFDFTNW